MSYFVYILLSCDFPKTYVGITSDVARRLEEHNGGKSRYTSKYKPWEVVHLEGFATRIEAREREKYFKSASGRRAMKKLLEDKK